MKKSLDTDGKKFHKYKKKSTKERLQHLLIDSVSVLNWLMSQRNQESIQKSYLASNFFEKT